MVVPSVAMSSCICVLMVDGGAGTRSTISIFLVATVSCRVRRSICFVSASYLDSRSLMSGYMGFSIIRVSGSFGTCCLVTGGGSCTIATSVSVQPSPKMLLKKHPTACVTVAVKEVCIAAFVGVGCATNNSNAKKAAQIPAPVC